MSQVTHDGMDHAYRQRVAPQYHVSAMNKSRLKYSIFFHYLLFTAMLIKIFSDILDRLDIFILAIEELNIPEPQMWEWIWCLSLLPSFFALSAIRKNQIKAMYRYIIGIIMFGYLPVIYGAVYYVLDIYEYVAPRETNNILKATSYKEYPFKLMFTVFFTLALQVHSFSIYFAWNLIRAWRARGTKKME